MRSRIGPAAARVAVGFATLRAVGAQSERDFPYAGLLALVRPLQDDLRGLPRAQADALGAVLTTDLAGVEAFAVSAGLLTLLTTAAERRPLLVLVDDLQWLDLVVLTRGVQRLELVVRIRVAHPGHRSHQLPLCTNRQRPIGPRASGRAATASQQNRQCGAR